MNIIHVASEVQPFSTTSSISECTGSLPRRLAALGHNVMMLSPLYSSIDLSKHSIVSTGLKTWVDAGYKVYEYEIFETSYDNVKYLFFKNDELFNRIGLYGAGAFDYSDNDIRFGTFCQAVMNYIKYHDVPVDILHAHDWQCALISVYKKLHYSDLACKTVLTIHSIDNLGVFNKFSLETLNLPWDIYNIDFMEYYDNISFIKGGVVSSDYLLTVSPTFAEELISDDSSLGLVGVFGPHADKLGGILSGISHTRWNPATDKLITANYSKSDLNGKAKCKDAVCKELDIDPNLPIITFTSKLMPSRGIELIIDGLKEFEALKANLIIIANNSSDYHQSLQQLNNTTKNIRFTVGYFKDSSHNIIAATDIVLTPSLYEPSCIMQMIAMRYGAIPVARKTGGAYDGLKSALDINLGFEFVDFSVKDMMQAVKKALALYNSTNRATIVKDVMSIDNSWTSATKDYEKLYKKVLGGL